MRRLSCALFIALFATMWLCSSAQANNLIIDGLSEFAPPTPATITFLQCAENDAAQTTYTFSAQNTGTASADRITYVGLVATDGNATYTINSVTVGGDTATEITDNGGAGTGLNAGIYAIANSAGTSEDVVVTYSEAITGAAICLWQGNNSVVAATDTATVFDTNSGAVAGLDTDVPADGILIGICTIQQGGATHSWTAGPTERIDDPNVGADAQAYSAADYDEDASASTPLTIGMTGSGASDVVCTIASFNHA